MKSHSEDEFLRWASGHGMGLDPRYPQSASLTFIPAPELDRFWKIPDEPEQRPYFLRCMLDAFGSWQSYWCWRHLGSWPTEPDPQRINDHVEHTVYQGIGVPEGTADVLQFDSEEEVGLVTLLFTTSVFGWSVGEDLFLVPDTGAGILQTDHHGVVHATFKTNDQMRAFIGRMEDEGFPLPDHVPDSTFKTPTWMQQ